MWLSSQPAASCPQLKDMDDSKVLVDGERGRDGLLEVFLERRKALVFLGVGLFLILIGLLSSFFEKKQQIFVGKESVSTFSNEATTSAQREIIIDVEGAVIRTGVYRLPSDSRVQDALVVAGGMAERADREYVAKTMNLAAKLADGGKVYIPFVGEIKGTSVANFGNLGSVSGGGSVININVASLSDLDALPGVGGVTAQKIIDGRPYSKTEDLVEKKIVNKSVFEKIKGKIAVY